MKKHPLQVFRLQHPLKADLERQWSLEADLARTLQAVELLAGPPEFFRVSAFFASALYTQALVSYVRCFTTGRRKGLDIGIFEGRPDLLKIHDHVKSIRDKHVSHPVSDYEQVNLLVAAVSPVSPSKGIGVHHIFFAGAGPNELKEFLAVVKYVHGRVNSELNKIGTQIAKEVIGGRATWKGVQKHFWGNVNGEDVYGPGW